MTKAVEDARMTLRRLLPTMLFLVLDAAVRPAGAVGSVATPVPNKVETGQTLARAWCASCHAVEPGAEAPFADIPSFVEVAHMPSTTGSALRAFLSTPHGDMPDVKLKAGELDAVIAYVLSLKDK